MNHLIMDDFGMRNNKIEFYTKTKNYSRTIKFDNCYAITIGGVSRFSIIKPNFTKYKAKMSDVNHCVTNAISYHGYKCIPNVFGLLRVL